MKNKNLEEAGNNCTTSFIFQKNNKKHRCVKMKNIAIIVVTLTLISLAFTMSAQANGDTTQTNGDTIITINVVTDGNVIASFDTTASGTVTYWLDGIEVLGEFTNLWEAIVGTGNGIKELDEGMHSNYLLVSQAYTDIGKLKDGVHSNFLLASQAHLFALQNEEELNEHGQTLLIHYDAINDTYTKLYVLRDEVVAFEAHYLDFENETNSTLGIYGEDIAFHEGEINTLRAEVKNLNGIIALIRNTLIALGLIAGALFLVSRRYPVGEVIVNGYGSFKNGYKQYKIVDFVQKTEAIEKPAKRSAIRNTK